MLYIYRYPKYVKFRSVFVTVLLCCFIGCCGIEVAHAEYTNGYPEFEWNGQTFNNTTGNAYHWKINSGELELIKDDTEEVARSWTPDSWKAYNSVTQDTTEAVGRASGAEADIESGDTSVNTPTVQGATDGVSTVTDARAAGTSVDVAEQTGLDLLGEAGGTLPAGLGVTALGGITLGPVAFKLGVEIGNGLSQLWGEEPWHPLEEAEGKEIEKTNSEHPEDGVQVEDHSVEGPTADNVFSGFPAYKLSKGYYLHSYEAWTYAWQRIERSHTCTGPGVCSEGSPKKVPLAPQAVGGFGNEQKQTETVSSGSFGSTVTVELIYRYKSPESCTVPPLPEGEGEQALDEWEENLDSEKFCLKPEGVPGPTNELLTPTIEASNEAHGLPAKPKIKEPIPELPKAPPTTLPQKRTHEIWESEHPDKDLKEHTTEPKKKKEEEEEAAIIILPYPGENETAPEYKKRLEKLGLNHVEEYTLSDTEINPHVGPNGVADTAPPEGSRVSPETKVEIAANPSDAAPPSESKGSVGPPTEPGIKLPHFVLLCTVFPFGVPCWLKKQLEAFSSTGAPPTWTIGPIEWGGTKIPKAEIDLAKIEPIMEVVRPFMIIFGGIGIVFFFYKVFTGTSIGGGENPSGQVPDPSSDYGPKEVDDEGYWRGWN